MRSDCGEETGPDRHLMACGVEQIRGQDLHVHRAKNTAQWLHGFMSRHATIKTAQDQSMPVKFCILLPRTDYPRLAQSCMRIESYSTTTAEHDFMSRQINYDSISVAQSDKTVLKDRRGPCSRLVQPALNRTGASSSRPADGNGQTERGRRHRWSLFTV